MGRPEGLIISLPVVEAKDIQPGTVIQDFDCRPPCTDDVCRENISTNLSRGLPELFGPRKGLTVIANGPSARFVDLKELTQRTETLSVNGSLKLFLDQGVYPTFWAVCDPQELVVDFLPENPPQETTYLVASKCHPRVFEKLKNNRVLIWHLNDIHVPGKINIPPTCSITVCAAWLMIYMGYVDLEFWGWDGCFLNDRHHAVVADDFKPEVYLNYGGTIVKDSEGHDKVEGGRFFPTTVAWAAEAKGAEQFFQLAKYFDVRLTLHGGGMFATAKDFLNIGN